MAPLKIDFYFEVFKQLKTTFWVISQEQHSLNTLKFTELKAIFIASRMKKTHI